MSKTNKTQSEDKNPILYSNKIFSASHKKTEFRTKKEQRAAITTENVVPVLEAEIKREEITQEIMENANKSVSKQRSKKNRWLSAIFLFINLAVLAGILIYQFSNEDIPTKPFIDLLADMHWEWVFLGVVLFMVINIVDSARIFLPIKKVTGRSRPWLSYKSTLTCRFYDSITPLATGGQPFQVFYLTKRGLNASAATSVPLAKYIYSQVTFILFVFIVLVCSGGILKDLPPLATTMCIIGLVLNVALIASVAFLSASKKIGPAILRGLLKFANKLHFIKDYNETFDKYMKVVREYISTFRMFMTSGWIVALEFLLSCLYLLAVYSIPFFVYCMFAPFDISLWYQMLVLQIVCDLAISFIPIPGGAGTAELTFFAMFGTFFKDAGVFAWAMLFWRILTYYGYLLQGALVMLYDFALGNKKIGPLLARFKDEERRAKSNSLGQAILNVKAKPYKDKVIPIKKDNPKNKRRK